MAKAKAKRVKAWLANSGGFYRTSKPHPEVARCFTPVWLTIAPRRERKK